MAQKTRYTSKLHDTRVLIIGGSSGIGFGVAEAVLEFGGSVVISSSSPDRVAHALERLQMTYSSAKGRMEGYVCDVGSQATLESEVNDLFSRVASRGKLNHVVFTAGDVLAVRNIEDFSLQDMQQAGMVRFFAPLVVAKHLRKHLESGVSSSFTLSTGGVPYHLMKDWAVIHGYLAGIDGLVRGLSVDLTPIRVNAVGLGVVQTELWDAAKEAGTFDRVTAAFTAKMTTGKVANVEDVVEAFLYLMRDHNVAGTTVNSNGGVLRL